MDVDVFRRIFGRFPEVEAVLLFGSEATGNTHSESDLDLAVVSGDPGVAEKKLDMLEALAREGFCNVDLVFFRNDDIVLAFEIIRHRRVAYHRESFNLPALYSKIVRQYFDFYSYLSVQREAYRQRILKGQRRNPQKTPQKA